MQSDTHELARFGFSLERGGAHSSRTLMLGELVALLDYVREPEACRADYRKAIEESNCLGKRSVKTRALTYRHLVDLYGLDPSQILFRALHSFWWRDQDARPLLALLCVYARDSIFRASAPFILKHSLGTQISREALEAWIDQQEPGRFSKATLKSTAQNINSSWTKSGHLRGKAVKIRQQVTPTAGSITYALLLAYLSGGRGALLFQSEYVKLLDCSDEHALELAEVASRRGWMVLKRLGEVIEVQFPGLINPTELEWLREQG